MFPCAAAKMYGCGRKCVKVPYSQFLPVRFLKLHDFASAL